MKVTLPDGAELELPDGATGLDAARAIGPKLAEQAVLVRSNGSVQDLRLPLQDGQPVQFLTTRDTGDADALYVLRHSSAHLLAEAVRRLYPGVKVAIGPPIEHGFYYDFEFPEPISEADLERIENEVEREIAEGRVFNRQEISRDEARKRFEEEGEPYKVELVDTAEGDISLVHARATSPTSAAARTCRTRARSRRSSSPGSPARTGAGTSATPSSRGSTAPPSSARATSTTTSRGSRRRASAITAASGRSSTCSTSTTSRPGRRSGTPRGW